MTSISIASIAAVQQPAFSPCDFMEFGSKITFPQSFSFREYTWISKCFKYLFFKLKLYDFLCSYTFCFNISFKVSRGCISISTVFHKLQMMYYCFSHTVAREIWDLVNYSDVCQGCKWETERAYTDECYELWWTLRLVLFLMGSKPDDLVRSFPG